jgi:hypothetical protein
MIRMEVTLNNSQLEELLFFLRKAEGGLHNTEKAMAVGAGKIQGVWQNYALGNKRLPGVAALKNPNRKYAESIRTKPTGPFEHEIYSEAEIADWIENGTKELDMKKTHPYGPRSRISKEGFPYVIIPFQWGTPGDKKNQRVGFHNVMPINIYNIVSKFKKMETKVSADSPHAEKSHNYQSFYGNGEMAGRARYNKGYDRLEGRKFGNMEGMVRTTDSTGKDRSAGYFTFRVISAKQLLTKPYSWIRPAEPAYHVTRGVKEYTEDEVAMTAREGLEKDFGL